MVELEDINERTDKLIFEILNENGPSKMFDIMLTLSRKKREDPERFRGLTGCEDQIPVRLRMLTKEGKLKKVEGKPIFYLPEHENRL
jgi:hypothetical protein